MAEASPFGQRKVCYEMAASKTVNCMGGHASFLLMVTIKTLSSGRVTGTVKAIGASSPRSGSIRASLWKTNVKGMAPSNDTTPRAK